jgi:hypothetical protein
MNLTHGRNGGTRRTQKQGDAEPLLPPRSQKAVTTQLTM